MSIKEFFIKIINELNGQIPLSSCSIDGDEYDIYTSLYDSQIISNQDTIEIQSTENSDKFIFLVKNLSLKFAIEIDINTVENFDLFLNSFSFNYKGIKFEIETNSNKYQEMIKKYEFDEFF
jgi:hypothetical protein